MHPRFTMNTAIFMVILLSGCAEDRECWKSYEFDEEIYAVGGCNGQYPVAAGHGTYRFTGSSWKPMDNQSSGLGSAGGIYCMGSNKYVAVSYTGYISTYDGNEWSDVFENPEYEFNDAWGTDLNNIYAVGKSNNISTIMKYDGISWNQVYSGNQGAIIDIWGADDQSIVSVGWEDGPVILHYDGIDWKKAEGIGIDHVLSVWGASKTDIFAVGSSILRFDGVSWTDLIVVEEHEFMSLWGDGIDNVYAVGLGGEVYNFDGTSWTKFGSNLKAELYDVWVDSEGTVYAVGSGWDGIESIGKIYVYTCNR